jgi:hypothetical protein
MKTNNKYKIYYSGIGKYGYVKVVLRGNCGEATKEAATIFRLKFIADIICWVYNKSDENFNTYTVVKLPEAERPNTPRNNFIKHCLQFKKREPFFIYLGIFTWLAIIAFVALLIITSVLIYQYNTL